MSEKRMTHREFVALINEKRAEGEIVYMGLEGPEVVSLDGMLSQPAEGILYDINRLPEVVATFIERDEDYGAKWVNDYAVCDIITELKRRNEASLSREKVLREALEETLRCITSEYAGGYLAEMRDQNRRASWYLDKCIPAEQAARAALASTETEK